MTDETKQSKLNRLLKIRELEKTYPYSILNLKENLDAIEKNLDDIENYTEKDHIRVKIQYEKNYDKRKYLRHLIE
jgi:DNA repair ATPase RecN